VSPDAWRFLLRTELGLNLFLWAISALEAENWKFEMDVLPIQNQERFGFRILEE
jgi:hypothetical protein